MVSVVVASLSKIAVNVALPSLSGISISGELKLQLSDFIIYHYRQPKDSDYAGFIPSCLCQRGYPNKMNLKNNNSGPSH